MNTESAGQERAPGKQRRKLSGGRPGDGALDGRACDGAVTQPGHFRRDHRGGQAAPAARGVLMRRASARVANRWTGGEYNPWAGGDGRLACATFQAESLGGARTMGRPRSPRGLPAPEVGTIGC